MPSSTAHAVSRYRPAILILAGAAAAYATYLYLDLVYSTSQPSPGHGLHRSNAVRRLSARQQQRAAQTARMLALVQGENAVVLGELSVYGRPLSLSPRHLDELAANPFRHALFQQRPGITAQEVEATIVHVHDTFLDRLFAAVSPGRLLSSAEVEAIAIWVGDRIQDNTAIARAVQRHAAALSSGEAGPVEGAESVAPTELSWMDDEDTVDDAIDSDGQTLQRALYHIAEDRARQEGVVHRGITCNGCDEKPIRGLRWHCANCADFDLCSNCEATHSHIKTHIFYKIRVPAPYLNINKQEPLYPGKPHMMSSSIDSALKKRLVAETMMEAEEIEALWDQFTCLAGTEWLADTNNVGWALDRRAFNHAFIPRYNSFIAAPNLIYDRIFAYYDMDKNGLIGFEEWIKGLDGMHSATRYVRSWIVFNGYDIDGDGYISRRDVLRIFRAYYAIEKEATRNYVAEVTEDLSVRNALDTIRSSQPLGSAFPPYGLTGQHGGTSRLRRKPSEDFENTLPVLQDDHADVADREEILRATNFRNVGEGESSSSEQDRTVTDRWARRQFYVDEEEGLNQPEGAEDDVAFRSDESADEKEQAEDPEDVANQPETRPIWSRSSSRVRFQDNVDVETRSNASTSSRPVGERWGGYEIPEPEKDLGKEVLYQITQQGFNELLDPLFQDRENNAMDAYATRSERRKSAVAIEQTTECFKTQMKAPNRAICMIGIFRYTKCIVDMFCKAVNDGSTYSKFSHGLAYDNFRGIFHNEDGTKVDREEARIRLMRILDPIEKGFISTVNVAKEWTIDNMSLWNAWLCSNQVWCEIITAALSCASRSGWISDLEPGRPSDERNATPLTLSAHQDPTMPQFRPNSLVDIEAVSTSFNQPLDAIDVSDTSDDSSVSEYGSFGCYLDQGSADQIRSDPKGPFFAFGVPAPQDTRSAKQETTNEENEAVSAKTPSLSSPPDEFVILDQFPGPASSSTSTPAPSDQSESDARIPVVNWRNYTNNPVIYSLYINSDSDIETLESSPKQVVHSTNPYQVKTDQSKPLVCHVRELAMNPKNDSHNIMLASLEVVQQEINERKGSGLINFEEFDEYMKEGRLRFLESWMEWVSI